MSGFGVFLAAELRAAVSEDAFEPEDRRDRFEAIDEFDFELAEPRDPSEKKLSDRRIKRNFILGKMYYLHRRHQKDEYYSKR